ncbi:transcriptional adapter 1 [Maylandia zebra]|uniref:Transcriptional adapter 1 n=2 Tax=Pseudocrenilabrinae TaxID=318546 RepID=A0A3Q4GJE2_NEOBR|nr:transcriptional adapter 1 [Maylandia zebra]XP_006786985.1 transcriptional adapter 1 [Neolamprologus brichardi]XP_026004778.1 transcriptional adapter 1 [Astatotilapia calliptera]XP_039878335.1 transcriptional adapter 1 [Simochromis diagramma]
MNVMAAHASELEIAKKNLTDAIGDNVKHYWANLKLWFKQKISKEEFDIEARRLLAQENVHVHNDFLLAILTRCQIIVSTPEGAGSLQWQGSCASKPGKPKGNKKCSSRQKFDHRFQPQNPLSAAQPFSPREGGSEEEELRLSAHTLLLPTRGQLEARMMVTAFEVGLDNVTEDAISTMIYAVEHHLKDVLTAVIMRRKAYRLRDSRFPYAFGNDVTPQPYLKNSLAAYHSVADCPPQSASLPAGPPPQVSPDEAEQQAVHLLACSADSLPAPLPPISMFDLLEALQVHHGVMPSHTMYALNMERVLSRLWHPSHEELEQDHVHRQRIAAKEGVLVS